MPLGLSFASAIASDTGDRVALVRFPLRVKQRGSPSSQPERSRKRQLARGAIAWDGACELGLDRLALRAARQISYHYTILDESRQLALIRVKSWSSGER
jgi:hypothetical protein